MRIREDGDSNLIADILRKYYDQGKNQEEIAKEIKISKSSVCRLLKKAEERGYIKFYVNPPKEGLEEASAPLKEKFSLAGVFVAPAYVKDLAILFRDACRGAARYIYEGVAKSDIICAAPDAASNTVAQILSQEFNKDKACAGAAAMCGLNKNIRNAALYTETITLLAGFFSAPAHIICAPQILETKKAAACVREIPGVGEAINAAASSRWAVFQILPAGNATDYSASGVFYEKDLKKIEDKNPAAEIAGRLYGADGKPIGADLNSRTLGISPEQLKGVENKLGIAVGENSVQAVVSAVKGGLINRLYTDEPTAKALLEAHYSKR